MRKYMFLLLIIFMSGCIRSVKTIDFKESLKPLSSSDYEIGESSEGLSSCFKLMFLFPVVDRENILKAEENAIAKEAADNMIEVSYFKETTYILLGKIDAYYVRGKAVKYKEK